MSNLDKELTMIHCAHCGKEIVIMNECIKPKMFCTIRCMDSVNLKGNINEGISC